MADERTLEDILAGIEMDYPTLALDKWAEDADGRTKVLKLEFPPVRTVKEGGSTREERLDVLTFRRPTGVELDMMERISGRGGGSIKQIREIAAKLTGEQAATLERLDVDDGMRVVLVTTGFFPQPKPKASPKIGEGSPAT